MFNITSVLQFKESVLLQQPLIENPNSSSLYNDTLRYLSHNKARGGAAPARICQYLNNVLKASSCFPPPTLLSSQYLHPQATPAQDVDTAISMSYSAKTTSTLFFLRTETFTRVPQQTSLPFDWPALCHVIISSKHCKNSTLLMRSAHTWITCTLLGIYCISPDFFLKKPHLWAWRPLWTVHGELKLATLSKWGTGAKIPASSFFRGEILKVCRGSAAAMTLSSTEETGLLIHLLWL